MYDSLFVPLDGSHFSEHALTWARSLAVRSGASLHLALVHVPVYWAYLDAVPILDDDGDAQTREAEVAYLQRVCDRLKAFRELKVTAELLDGPAVNALTDAASRHGCDLIVMTTHGRGGLSRLWLGSVADGLVRRSHIPTLLIRPDSTPAEPAAPPSVQQILIPLDGSLRSAQIIEPALALGKLLHARLTLLHVVEPFALHDDALYAVAPDLPELAQEATAKRCAEVQRELDGLAQQLRAGGVEVCTKVVAEHGIAPAIIAQSTQEHERLIALTTHGRGAAGRLLLGSVADKVVRAAEGPVLLFRPADIGTPQAN